MASWRLLAYLSHLEIEKQCLKINFASFNSRRNMGVQQKRKRHSDPRKENPGKQLPWQHSADKSEWSSSTWERLRPSRFDSPFHWRSEKPRLRENTLFLPRHGAKLGETWRRRAGRTLGKAAGIFPRPRTESRMSFLIQVHTKSVIL